MVSKDYLKNRSLSTFIKAQFSSLFSTIADFLLTHLLTEALGIWYLFSSAMGTISGGYINFTLGRHWVFRANDQKKKLQAAKYIIIWIGSLVLNTLGMFVFTEIFHMHYMVSKTLIAIAVGVFYNYYFQKLFVFRTKNEIC